MWSQIRARSKPTRPKNNYWDQYDWEYQTYLRDQENLDFDVG